MKKSILSILLVLTMLGAMGQSQISELSKNLVFRWEGSEWNPYRDMVSGTLGTATATYNVLDRQGSGRREVVYNGSTSYTTPPTTITFTESNAWTVIYKGTFKTFGWLFFHNGYNTGITDHSSKLSFKNDATNFYDFNATIASVSNISDKTLTFVANGSGGLSLYIDGVFSQTITGISGGTAITCDRLINSGFSGSISLVRIFNYALTPTQIANYSKPEYPIEWVDRGATGALNVSTTINHNYTSFTATSASAFSAVSNGSGLHLGGTADEINYLLGKIYRAKFTLTLNSGTAPQFGPDATISGAQGLTSAYVAAVNGVNQTDFIITTAATGVMLFFNNSSATNYSVSGLSVTQLGCVLDLNASGLSAATPTYWYDRTNSLTATNSGTSLVVPPASNLSATSFNGATSKVDMGDQLSFTLPTTFSISFWIYPISLTTDYQIILNKDAGGSANREYGVYTRTNGAIDVYLFNSTPNANYTLWSFPASTLVINVWKNIIIRHLSASNCELYVNGTIVTATKESTGFAGFANGTAPLLIGTFGSTLFLNALLSNVNIWKEALDADRIKLVYDAQF